MRPMGPMVYEASGGAAPTNIGDAPSGHEGPERTFAALMEARDGTFGVCRLEAPSLIPDDEIEFLPIPTFQSPTIETA